MEVMEDELGAQEVMNIMPGDLVIVGRPGYNLTAWESVDELRICPWISIKGGSMATVLSSVVVVVGPDEWRFVLVMAGGLISWIVASGVRWRLA